MKREEICWVSKGKGDARKPLAFLKTGTVAPRTVGKAEGQGNGTVGWHMVERNDSIERKQPLSTRKEVREAATAIKRSFGEA